MILENMNANEKMSQMKKLAPLLSERVNAYLNRNNSLIKKGFKTKEQLNFKRSFKFTEFGEWDVHTTLSKLSKNWAKISIRAYQKYYIKYAKDPSNIGAGFYVIHRTFDPIENEEKSTFIEITPHCVNRYRERVPEAADMSLDELKSEIIIEGGFGSCEFSPENRSEDDASLCNCTIHTLNGQFFGWITDTVNKYICYRTYVPNEILKREQIAYTIAAKVSGQSNYDTEEMREKADKMIVKMAKHGEDIQNIAEKKKTVMIKSSVDSMMSSIVHRINKKRIDKILGFK